MDDANGLGLKPGDSILVPAIIRAIRATELTTELTIEVGGLMLPSGIPSKDVYRANEGDAVSTAQLAQPQVVSGVATP